MNNKPVVISIILLFLGIIFFDQFGKYMLSNDLEKKDVKYEETLNHIDSTLIIVDNQINKVETLKKDKEKSTKVIDSLTFQLNNQYQEIQYVPIVRYVTESLETEPILEVMEVSELRMENYISEFRDSIIYNYIELDSITYIYDTITLVHIDTIIITDPSIIKRIKRKYLD
jgi:hypothetical protein